ncbi:hypothetical protein [Neobacillus massiliamazoniensis]|nr:hypothetical protein [Neobacillus massiliamazoniensis]
MTKVELKRGKRSLIEFINAQSGVEKWQTVVDRVYQRPKWG